MLSVLESFSDILSVHTASSARFEDIVWKMSQLLCKSLEEGENHQPSRFCIEVNVSRGLKVAVLQLHRYATLEGAVELL
jgi:hypothetical protein